MENTVISDAINKYFSAYENEDCHGIMEMLTDDFTFTSPCEDHIDRKAFLQRCISDKEIFKTLRIREVLEGKNDAIVLYEGKDNFGEDFHNANLFRFEGEKIKSVKVFFGSLPSSIDMK